LDGQIPEVTVPIHAIIIFLSFVSVYGSGLRQTGLLRMENEYFIMQAAPWSCAATDFRPDGSLVFNHLGANYYEVYICLALHLAKIIFFNKKNG